MEDLKNVVAGGRDLIRAARDGDLVCFEFSDRDRNYVEQLLPSLRNMGVAFLTGARGIGKSTMIYNLASAVAKGRAPPDFADRRLIEAPHSADTLSRFANAAPDMADQRDIVVLELDQIYAGSEAGDPEDKRIAAALTRLFAEGELWVIAVGTPFAVDERLKRQRSVSKARVDARDGVISFRVQLQEHTRPTERFMFRLPLADAQTLVTQVIRPEGHPLVAVEALLEELVRVIRDGGHKDSENETVLGAFALAIFSSGLTLRAGHSHVLSIEASGQRYRTHREYVYD